MTPAYTDLSLAIQSALHPIGDVDPDDVEATYEQLQDLVDQAVKREGRLVSDRSKTKRSSVGCCARRRSFAMVLVTAYPIGYAVVLSLQELDLRFPDEGGFVGLDELSRPC